MSTCVTGYEMQPREIDIGLLGYSDDLSRYGVRQIADNNAEQVVKYVNNYNDCELTLSNGTRIRAITNREQFIRGHKFDQLILFDDNRWMIKKARREDIYKIREFTMYMSNIPEEFQILEYEDIR